MRVIVLIKANDKTEAGVMPSEALLTEMGKYNEELVKAGVMLAGEGLHPSSKGARVNCSRGKITVTDGPFTETKELIAGFWIWQGEVSGEGDGSGAGHPQPGRSGRRGRNSPGVRGVGFRRRVHSRTQGARRAPAQGVGIQKVAAPAVIHKRKSEGGHVQKITPFLWFDNNAEEAMNFYLSIFKNSKVLKVARYGDAGPGPKGAVMTANFQLDGQEFVALNGGPHFKFTEAISFVVNCETQQEVDEFWKKLSEGGEESRC